MTPRLIPAVVLLSLASIAGASLAAAAPAPSKSPLDVRTFGATGDGKTKDTAAFQKALDACAAGGGGGEVVVPPGNYLIGSVVMGSNTTLRVEKDATLTGSPDKDDYPLTQVRWEGRWREGHRALIHAAKAERIAIVGPGTLVGDEKLGHLRNPRGPCMIEPIDCREVRVEGLTLRYSRMWGIHPTYCEFVLARGLTIRSKLTNSDGIDVDSCRNVRIEHCDIDSGDDAIALKSGRGTEGLRLARPTENVEIIDCALGSNFAGLGIGTEMSGGIRNVLIERCSFTRGSNGIFIKSNSVRGGYIENIYCKDLEATGSTTPGAFLRIDLVTKGNRDEEPVEGPAGIPTARNITFANIRSNCPTLVDGTIIAADKPLDGLSITNATGTCRKAIALANVVNAEIRDINVTGFTGPLLATYNVKGAGLEKAEPMDEPKALKAAAAGTSAPATRPAAAP